jgi:FtsZ-binding cell division protein ZapB
MTTDQLVERLAATLRRIQVLNLELHDLREDADRWQAERTQCLAEAKLLRRRVARLTESRDLWQKKAVGVNELTRQLHAARRSRDLWKQRVPPRRRVDPHPHGVILRPGDLDLILSIPPRG